MTRASSRSRMSGSRKAIIGPFVDQLARAGGHQPVLTNQGIEFLPRPARASQQLAHDRVVTPIQTVESGIGDHHCPRVRFGPGLDAWGRLPAWPRPGSAPTSRVSPRICSSRLSSSGISTFGRPTGLGGIASPTRDIDSPDWTSVGSSNLRLKSSRRVTKRSASISRAR